MGVASVAFICALGLILAITDIRWENVIDLREYLGQSRIPKEWADNSLAGNTMPRLLHGMSNYSSTVLRDTLVPFIGGPSAGAWLKSAGLGFLPLSVSVVILFLVLSGFISSIANQGILPVHLYLALYLGVSFLWPWQTERFLYGILPFLYAFLLVGAKLLLDTGLKACRVSEWTLCRALTSSWILGFCLLGLLFGANIIRSMRIDDSLNHVPDFRIGSTWIKEHAAPNAVVVTEQPQIVYLYSQRATLPMPDNAAVDHLVKRGDVYLLIEPELTWRRIRELRYDSRTSAMLEALQSNKIAAQMVFEDREAMVKVFRLSGDQGSYQSPDGSENRSAAGGLVPDYH